MNSISFGSFYQAFGFAEYPFSQFTSEHETEKGKVLFIDTQMYSPIIEGFRNKRTMILSGDRGTGKTAVLYDFLRNVPRESTIVVSVSDYSQLKLRFSGPDLYRFVLNNLSDELFRRMGEDRKTGARLKQADKVLLTYFLVHFTKPATIAELRRQVQEMQQSFIARAAAWFYDRTRLPLNIGANAAAKFLGELIARATSLPAAEAPWTEYFPELGKKIDETFTDPEASYSMLRKLVGLARKIGYDRVVFMFDKIDEDSRLDNASEEISDFIEPLVTDNKFLLDDQFQVVVSLWVIPFNMLKDRVRTQKIHCPRLEWSEADLLSALGRRLEVFSDGKLKSLAEIVGDDVDQETRKYLVKLSNHNPRDLWHLMNSIFQAQYRLDSNSSKLTKAAFDSGFDDFVRQFNFYEYYPRKANARVNSMDVYAYMKHLLKLESEDFTRNQLNERAGTGGSTQNYVSGMESIGLVERTGQELGSATFRIRDPKVVHALKRGIELLRSN